MYFNSIIFFVTNILLSTSISYAGSIYNCALSGSYVTEDFYMKFDAFSFKEVSVGGPKISFSDTTLEKVQGNPTLHLIFNGSDKLALVFSPAGGGLYLVGTASRDSKFVGFSHGLIDSNTGFSGSCYLKEN